VKFSEIQHHFFLSLPLFEVSWVMMRMSGGKENINKMDASFCSAWQPITSALQEFQPAFSIFPMSINLSNQSGHLPLL